MPLKPNSKKVNRKFSQRRQDSKGKFLNERASNSESDSAMSNNGNQEQEMQPEEQKNGYAFSRHGIRSNYMDKSIEAKKKVIRMLFVIIVEFFMCWSPLHILNTVYLFYPAFVYQYISSSGIALVQLMAYISSCTNPITYCFMNRRFRQAFLGIFNGYFCRIFCCSTCCMKQKKQRLTFGLTHTNCKFRERIHNGLGPEPGNNSEASNNESHYGFRQSVMARSEIVFLENEDRV